MCFIAFLYNYIKKETVTKFDQKDKGFVLKKMFFTSSLITLKSIFLGSSSPIIVSKQKDSSAARTSCIKQCNSRATEVGRVYVGIRRTDIKKYECKCLSRDSGDILGKPVSQSDVRNYMKCEHLITNQVSFFDSDSTLKKYLTESMKTLKTTVGQSEGTEPNICNSSQVLAQ